MTAPEPTVTVHMVASLDGFIAKADGSIGWMDTHDSHEAGVQMGDGADVLQAIDCYVMGSHTYEHAVALSKDYGWAYGDKPVYVVSSRALQPIKPTVEICGSDLAALINTLKQRYSNIWVVGGALVTKELFRLQLCNDIRMMVLPVLLGGGTPFFDHIGVEAPLHLHKVTAYHNGLVELWYQLPR